MHFSGIVQRRLLWALGILKLHNTFLATAAISLAACTSATRENNEWVLVDQAQYSVAVGTQKAELVVTGPNGIILALGDSDGDGAYDLLRYMAYDANGDQIIEVEDYEVNGSANMRWHWQEPSFLELWYMDAWRKIEKDGDRFYLEINGIEVPVKYQDGRFSAGET